MERDQQDERKQNEDDANEDLELKDDEADQVRGGLAKKVGDSTDRGIQK